MKSLPSGPRCDTCLLGGRAAFSHAPQSAGFMTSDGAMTSGVMIVAEALGHHEAVQEKALVGPSGFLMGRMMAKTRHEHRITPTGVVQEQCGPWRREEFYYTNVLRCQPQAFGPKGLQNKIRTPDGRLYWWAEEAIHHCGSYLDEEIERMAPKVIVTFGQTAFTALTGEDINISTARGYVFPEKRGRTWVVPTLHPSYMLRGNPEYTQVLAWDIDKARLIAREGFAYEEITCLMDPPVEEWERFVRGYTHGVLAVDIETPYKSAHADDEDELGYADATYTILRVSFAYEGHRGASVPFQMPYLPGIETLLKRASAGGPLVIWNRPYDRPRLQHNLSLDLPIHATRDTMDAWHVLYNALPRKLGFATSCYPLGQHGLRAWKHLSQSDPAYYSVIDAVALWRNDADIQALLAATGQQGVYDLFCTQLDPVLEHMTRNGLLVDQTLLAHAGITLGKTLTQLRDTMDAGVPLGVKQKKVWKSRAAADKGVALLLEKGELIDPTLYPLPAMCEEQTCTACGAHPVTKAHVTKKTCPAPGLLEDL